jgi:hypothetical protein
MITIASFHTLVQNAYSTQAGLFQVDNLAGYPQGDNYTTTYVDYSGTGTLGSQWPDSDMVAAVNYAVYYNVMEPDLRFEYLPKICSSGNCTWAHHSTLGVCSYCGDASNAISISGDNYLISNGLELDINNGLIASAGFPLYPDPSIVPGVGPLITKFVSLAKPQLEVDNEPVGIDCALWWCIYDTFYVTMLNYNETWLDQITWTDTSATSQTVYGQSNDIILSPDQCWDDAGEPIDPAENQAHCTKTVSAYAQNALQNFFRSPITGFSGNANYTSTEGYSASSEFIQVLLQTVADTDDIVDAYSTIAANVAFEMTVNIREQTKDGLNVDLAQGQTQMWLTLFHIRWGYMVVPALLVIFTFIFLLVTIVKSVGHDKWKASSLPLLFHGLAAIPEHQPDDLEEMKELAENTMVRLTMRDDNLKFV